MNRAFNLQKNIIVFGVPLLIIGIVVLIAKSSVFRTNPDGLSIGITFDLLLIMPLVYFLLIRKTNIPKTTVVPLIILGTLIGTLILPSENQYYLNLFKTWGLPIVELLILSFVTLKIRKAIKQYKLNQTESLDFFTALKSSCNEILPKGAAILVVTEITIFYYAFFYWKKRKLNPNEFTYHKDSGTISLLIAAMFIIAIETVTLHILLAKWNITIAWILTFLSIYSGIQILGFVKSMLGRPISIENNKLHLRYGIMNETTIDLSKIESIEISSKDLEKNKETRKLSFLGELESHNVVIRLKEEHVLTGLYGIKRKYKNLALHVDQKNEFKDQMNNAI